MTSIDMKSASAFESSALAHIASRIAKGTRDLYAADFNRWLDFCRDSELDPARPKLEDATTFRNELQSKQKPLTVRRTLASLSSIYGAVLDQEVPLATWNPFKRLPRPSGDAYSRTEALSIEESEAIISATGEDWRNRAILLMLYETGLRRASVASLRKSDLITRAGALVARVVIKGGKYREVEVPERATLALVNWLEMTDSTSVYVFPALRSNGSLIPSAINKILLNYAKKAGVKHAHPHRFRAAYATAALDAGVPLHEVQASLHHADPKTTLRYDRGVRGTGVSGAVAKFRNSIK
jgi:integrase